MSVQQENNLLADYFDGGDKDTDIINTRKGTQKSRAIARKNVINYLPYLSRLINRYGVRTLEDFEDGVERQRGAQVREQGGYYEPIPHRENLHSVLNAETSPFALKAAIADPLMTYDTSRGYGRTHGQVLRNWAQLFRNPAYDGRYDGVARELEGHVDFVNRFGFPYTPARTAMEYLVPEIDLDVRDDDDVQYEGTRQDDDVQVISDIRHAEGSGYKIKKHTRNAAKKLGVEVKPSQLGKKKIDVFRGGRKVASVGHTDYCDYPSYIECCGTKMANARREAYKARHGKSRNKEGTPSYYADKLLW